MKVKNFLFHRVTDQQEMSWPPMPVRQFDRVVRFITTHYQVLSFEALMGGAYTDRSTRPLATIMFDDGYKDNLFYAADILKKYNCPASFYVVTGCIDEGLPTWTYLLDHYLSGTAKKDLTISSFKNEFKSVHFNFSKDVRSRQELQKIKPWLKTVSNEKRVQVLKEIFDQLDDVSIPSGLMMNWDEVRQLKQAGFVIGSHTHSHPLLASLEDESEIMNELSISRGRLYSALNMYPETISYPVGSYDNRVKRLAAATGYKYGLAVEQRFYNSAVHDIYEVPRVELYAESWWKTRARINGIYSFASTLWKKIK